MAALRQNKDAADEDVARGRAAREAVVERVQEWEQRHAVASESLTQSRLGWATSSTASSASKSVSARRRASSSALFGRGGRHRPHRRRAPAWAGRAWGLGDVLAGAAAAAGRRGAVVQAAPPGAGGRLRRRQGSQGVQILQSQKDRLGAVNVDAVQELDEEEGNFSQLEQEVEDLKESRKTLMETLKRLEAESKTLFEDTFQEARKNFQEIFRKLFQGGKADMFLSNMEDDMLEAGMIVAQPPASVSINLLSGGERSMTAVAILFALFKVRPSPSASSTRSTLRSMTNVERFLRVLRDFTGETQFCVVTHKRTMAECQVSTAP